MGKSKTVKCQWKHCRHESKDVPREDAVRADNGKYYHKDCLEEKQKIDEIINFWGTKINPLVNYGQLHSVLNNLIYKKNVEPDYIFYTVKLGQKEGWLHYPQGLYRSVDNFKRHEDWKKSVEAQRIPKEVEIKADDPYKVTTEFHYTANKKRGFSQMLGVVV